MKLAALIPPDAMLQDTEASDKEGILREMVGLLVEKGRLPEENVESVVKALLSREELGSTGIGKGVGVPHAKHDGVKGLIGVFARSSRGVDFAALDGQPVHLFFLLLSSKENSGQHLEALARVARVVRDERFCRFMKQAKDSADLHELLQEADVQLDAAETATR